MTATARAGWLGALALMAGCPLPQSVPESRGSAAPGLRILFEYMSPQDTFIDVSKTCPSQPAFTLRGTLSDLDQAEVVEARWFYDYDPATSDVGIQRSEQVPGNSSDDLRPLQDFIYRPFDWAGPSYGVHVVEVVASNAFDAQPDQGSLPLPNRTPLAGYQTLSFRWVFRYVDSGGSCSR